MPIPYRILFCTMLAVSGCHIITGLGDVDEVSGSAAGGGDSSGTGGQGGGGTSCGDGVLDPPNEACDEGPADTASCDDDCTLVECGDSHINEAAGESCDDGNTANGDGCSSECVLESCGNGRVDSGEDCDDGNDSNNDDCLNNCNAPICGDGYVHSEGAATEQCDDGNGNNNDGCPDGVNGTCQPAVCGDGHVHNEGSGTEACDDGNNIDEDDCLNSCATPSCGDGVIHNLGSGDEQCDDGGANNNNGDCLLNCMAASCGDGFLHSMGAASETCDDSNTNGGDGCSLTCAREQGACCTGEGAGSCVVGPFSIGMSALNESIPDGGHPNNRACETFNFTQLGCGNVADVNVTMGVDHSFVGDLVVRLEGPDTTIQDLMVLPGTMTIYDSSNMSSAAPVTYDDEAAPSAMDMGAGISNNQTVCQNPASPCNYYPTPGSLSAFDGSSPVGSWELCVSDAQLTDIGTLQSVMIEITTD